MCDAPEVCLSEHACVDILVLLMLQELVGNLPVEVTGADAGFRHGGELQSGYLAAHLTWRVRPPLSCGQQPVPGTGRRAAGVS